MQPLVSIIIPVYNADKYLVECIESVKKQTWQNKEVIIIDDGSTDDSLNIARQYECNWITVLHQQNKGASAARNKGLDAAKGEYIQFLDADDLLSADKIEKQVDLLAGTTEHIAVCSTVHFPDGQDPKNFKPSQYEEQFLENIQMPAEFLIKLWGGYDDNGSMVQPNAWLISAEVIKKAGQWDERLSLDDDGEFFCRVLLASKGIKRETTAYNYYRKFSNAGSLSAQKSYASFQSILLAAKLKYQHLKAATSRPEVDKLFARNFLEIGVLAYPQYPGISKEAILLSRQLYDNASVPIIGGPKVELIKKLLGWRWTRYLQLFANRIFGYHQ